MFWKLMVIFTVLPAVELALLIHIGKYIGTIPTLALILGTGIMGAALAKSQGWMILNQIRSKLQAGVIPGRQLVNGLCVLAGGLLLLTPGLITDAMGILLILPGSRDIIRERIIHWMKKKIRDGDFQIRMR